MAETKLKDQALASEQDVAFSVYKGSAQENITNNTDVTVTWSTEAFDIGGHFADPDR